MNYLQLKYPRFDVDEQGNVYKDSILMKSFRSNGYRQVVLVDDQGNQKVAGVHCVVAMKYLDYYEGCIVHHKDQDRSNNHLDNLEVKDSVEHLKYHGQQVAKTYSEAMKGKIPWNKGKKMSDDFRKKCSESAKKRVEREKELGIVRTSVSHEPMSEDARKKLSLAHKGKPFQGNQYVDQFHNRKLI